MHTLLARFFREREIEIVFLAYLEEIITDSGQRNLTARCGGKETFVFICATNDSLKFVVIDYTRLILPSELYLPPICFVTDVQENFARTFICISFCHLNSQSGLTSVSAAVPPPIHPNSVYCRDGLDYLPVPLLGRGAVGVIDLPDRLARRLSVPAPLCCLR